ncbi:MAG: acyl-ACP thioesterase domain-containing protein [Actinomycetota bacterium]
MPASTPAPDAAEAPVGRRFTGHRKVRLGDAAADGRLRFDALTRHTQDVSDDDTTDAGLSAELGWVVRRTTVSVERHARLGEELAVTTYCSGLGKRWADRRLDIEGSEGARITVVTLWICIDVAAARPAPLSAQFLDLYGPAAQGRTVSARLQHPKAPAEGAETWSWPLRVADIDTQGHVNNAAYWAVLEEALGGVAPEGAHEARIEYGAGLTLDDEVTVHHAEVDGVRLWWLLNGAGETAASISLAVPD